MCRCAACAGCSCYCQCFRCFAIHHDAPIEYPILSSHKCATRKTWNAPHRERLKGVSLLLRAGFAMPASVCHAPLLALVSAAFVAAVMFGFGFANTAAMPGWDEGHYRPGTNGGSSSRCVGSLRAGSSGSVRDAAVKQVPMHQFVSNMPGFMCRLCAIV